MRNVVIVGSGCAGNTAAIYTARANLKPLVVTGHEGGGQLALTTQVENFPGFPEGVDGPRLVESMKLQAQNFGAEYVDGAVIEADLSKRPFRLSIEGEWVEARTVIIASGASARWLGLPSERSLIGHGVSSCATCDGFFYKDKRIMVVGGGDSAMEEANFLTRYGREVALVHRRDQFRASKIMLDRTRHNPKIRFVPGTVVDEVHDPEQHTVTGVTLRNVASGHTWREEVDGLFVAIGHIPNTAVFRGQVATDAAASTTIDANSSASRGIGSIDGSCVIISPLCLCAFVPLCWSRCAVVSSWFSCLLSPPLVRRGRNGRRV